jgi:hypothetical protein
MTSQITAKTLPCFVISLEQDTERRDHMHRQLDALGLRAEFVPAVNGSSLAPGDWSQYDRERCLQIYGVEMMPNEIGCFLSHYRLYERVVRENLPVALIMEDDLEIRPEFPLVLEDLLKAENPRWAVGRLARPSSWLLVLDWVGTTEGSPRCAGASSDRKLRASRREMGLASAPPCALAPPAVVVSAGETDGGANKSGGMSMTHCVALACVAGAPAGVAGALSAGMSVVVEVEAGLWERGGAPPTADSGASGSGNQVK